MFTGEEIKDWIIIVVGNLFIAVMVFRMFSHYAKREWGEMLTNFLVAVFIAWIVYSTDTFIGFLKWAANKVTGGESQAAGQLLDGAHGAVLTAADSAPQALALLSAGLI